MADATADADFKQYGDVIEVELDVAASQTIYKGCLVQPDAGGDLEHAGDDALRNRAFLAAEYVDNSSGADGDKACRCIVFGMVSGSISTALTAADIGKAVYASDSSTITDSSATNDVPVGLLVGFDGSDPIILIGGA